MTREEIIKKGKFIPNVMRPEYSQFNITLHLEFFNKEQEIQFAHLPNLEAEPQMTIMTEIINELINFDAENKSWLKDEVWKHYDISIKNTSYGMVPEEGFENETEANRAYFKIYNSNDAYNALQLEEVWTDLDFTDFRYFNLIFHCPWDDEHGISIGVKNGVFDSIN